MLRRLLLLLVAGILLATGGRIMLLIAASGTPNAADSGEVATVPTGTHRAAIIFGAGLRDGKPGPLLADRIKAGEKLLAERRVDLLLLTGDNSKQDYDEPGAMYARVLADGVPPAQIAVDYGGRRTWDSCVRAHKVFGVRRAIIVTNDFHRARTVVSCKAAGIDVEGAVGTSTGPYRRVDQTKWKVRELVASWRGGVDAWIRHPKVPVGGSPIDPYDSCAVWASLSAEDRGVKPDDC